MLVGGVLLMHGWLLGNSHLLLAFRPDANPAPQAFTVRHIEASPRSPSRAAAVRRPPQVAPAQPQADTLAGTAVDVPSPAPTSAPPVDLGAAGTEFSAPVSLPARVAEAVDLPPYNRPASEFTAAEITAYKAPSSARIKYDIKGFSRGTQYAAGGDLTWRQDGQSYEARMEVGAFLLGSRVQTSVGALGNEGLMPLRFGDKSRSELAAHFQRDKNIISFSANTPDVPLLKGAQDRLSIVFQLSALLAADPERFPVGTMLSFQTVSQREAEMWQFVVEKEERLQLPYGELATVKLNRNPRRSFDQHIELWFAPSLGFLPARLRITNANGDYIDQVLQQAQMSPP